MEVSEQIIEILDYLGDKIGVTIDWTSENVLPYVSELITKFINWEIWTSAAWIIIATSVVGMGIIFAIICQKTGSWLLDLSKFALIITFIVAIMIVGNQVFDIITAKTFPEKAIYDYLKFWGRI